VAAALLVTAAVTLLALPLSRAATASISRLGAGWVRTWMLAS
jgi:hypothetical protein